MDKPYSEQPQLHVQAPHRAALLSFPGNLEQALKDAQEDSTKTLFGIAHGIPSVYLTKIFASIKPDFIWIDAEHAMFDRLTLYDAIQAVQYHSEGRTLAIVRPGKHDEVSLATALDAGAAGIVIPHCESAQEVKDMIYKIKYPPVGGRSFCPWTFIPGVVDASLYSNDPNNMTLSNGHIAVIAQIESVKGMESLEEIAVVPGVSSLMFGPNDYCADAGIPGPNNGVMHPELLAAMARFSEIGAKYNKPLLGGVPTVQAVPMLIEQGYRVISLMFDNWAIARLLHGDLALARNFASQSIVPKET